jgi:hypothetical protein
MAHLGAKVTLLERHPILFTLLEDSHFQAQNDPFLKQIVDRIHLVFRFCGLFAVMYSAASTGRCDLS